MANAIETLRNMQAKEKEFSNVWGVCAQLIELCEREPGCAEILAEDLENDAMHPREAERKIRAFADSVNQRDGGNVCIPPQKAEEILRKFYGLPKRGAAPEPSPVPASPLGDFDPMSFL